MKDKLVKNKHGRFYYRSMSFLRGLGLTIAALVVLSAPVVIAYGINVAETKALEEETSLSSNSSVMENPVVAAPTYKGFLGANFRQGKWSVVSGLQYINGLYTAIGDAEQKENFCLLNATVDYALCPNISLWLRGENLLAQRYEINLGYPMPRATFMGGVHVAF